jgi:hypothetical protein
MMTVAFFGHHKCATQYIKAVLREIATRLGRDFSIARGSGFFSTFMADDVARLPVFRPDERRKAKDASPVMLFFPNANHWAVAALAVQGAYRAFHMIRDPRDIIVSGYFSHLYSHGLYSGSAEHILDWRRQLVAAATVEDGLLLELEFEAWNFENIANWDYGNPAIMEIRYECLITNPLGLFTQVAKFLGVSVPANCFFTSLSMLREWLLWRITHKSYRQHACLPQPILSHILRKHAFERKTGNRQRGEEDVKHHYRKGIAGDWRNYFTPRVEAAFEERYCVLRERFGYAK